MKNIKLTSTGLTGKQWIKRLEKGGYNIGPWAKEILESKDFKPSKKGIKYEVAFLKVSDLNKTSATTQELKREAQRRGWGTPDHETVLLIREAISDKEMEEMGIWYIVALHDPITGSGGDPLVLRAGRRGGGRWVGASWGDPDDQWFDFGAFAFPVLASSPQNFESLLSFDPLNLELPKELTINGKLYKQV